LIAAPVRFAGFIIRPGRQVQQRIFFPDLFSGEHELTINPVW
jgi:hypothetical protein